MGTQNLAMTLSRGIARVNSEWSGHAVFRPEGTLKLNLVSALGAALHGTEPLLLNARFVSVEKGPTTVHLVAFTASHVVLVDSDIDPDKVPTASVLRRKDLTTIRLHDTPSLDEGPFASHRRALFELRFSSQADPVVVGGPSQTEPGYEDVLAFYPSLLGDLGAA